MLLRLSVFRTKSKSSCQICGPTSILIGKQVPYNAQDMLSTFLGAEILLYLIGKGSQADLVIIL